MTMKGLIFSLGTWIIVGMFIIVGCASLQPTADPLVVRTEQAEQLTSASFDFVVTFDDSNRDYWRTNAPAFHNFAEWLRTPVPTSGTNTERRGLMMIEQVDAAKTEYQDLKTMDSSNNLFLLVHGLESLQKQASAWSVIVKSPSK